RQQRRRYIALRQCSTDVAEALPDRIGEGTAGVLEQMPSVGDLRRVWQRAGDGRPVAAVAVARHDLDPRPRSDPNHPISLRTRVQWLMRRSKVLPRAT